jgi:hypothetical protein
MRGVGVEGIPGGGATFVSAPGPIEADAPPAAGPEAPPGEPRASGDGLRLPALRAAAVEAGTSTAKSEGPEGKEKVLSAHHVRRIDQLFARVSPEVAREIEAHLAAIGGPDAALGGALYLKAAAARMGALTGGPRRERERALETLGEFARRLDGMSGAEMLARATVVDLDSRVSTSDFDPKGMDVEDGKPGPGGAGDTETDNDGLYQRFTASCGPTTIEILLCEDDPVRAFAVHDAGLHSPSGTDLAGKFQAEVLEKYGGVAITRHSEHTFARVKTEIAKLRRSGGAEGKDLDALRDYMTRKGELTAGARRAIEAIRAKAGGFPEDADLEEIRKAHFPKKDEGLGFEEFGKALADYLTPVTGRTYVQTFPLDGFGRGKAALHLDAVERALKRGIDVPFGISEPPHWMLLTAVAGKKPDRRFLVTDPDGGRTDWVAEKDFVSGKFIWTEPFSLGKEKGHVDSFFLPEEVE